VKNHPVSPVLALEHNVTWAFENATPYAGNRLAASVEAGLIDPEIGLNCDDTTAPPMGPCVRKENDSAIPQLHISLKHLELLWSFIYAWMVIYERGIQMPLIAGTWSGAVDMTDAVVRRASQLRDWSASLRMHSSTWPQGLPSPIHYENDHERYYGEKANLVFQQATAFILGHEHAHATLRHLDFVTKNAPDIDVIEAEKEADVAAFESIVEYAEDEDEKLSKAWSILAALLSSVYLAKEIRSCFIQQRHPSLHHRLSTFMRMLNFRDERYRYYFPMLCCVILDFTLDELVFIPRAALLYEDAQEAFEDTLDRIEAWVTQV